MAPGASLAPSIERKIRIDYWTVASALAVEKDVMVALEVEVEAETFGAAEVEVVAVAQRI
jgi:hypothetical protein